MPFLQSREALPLLLAALLLAALAAYWLGKRLLSRLARLYVARTGHAWGDALVRHKAVSRLSQLLPACIVYVGLDLLPQLEDSAERLLLKLISAYVILATAFVLTALLSAANAIYETYPLSRQRPLKGFAQLAQLALVIIGGLLVVSVLLERSPWLLLSGFGAMTAVLLLVFRDTILSLVANLQLTAQELVRLGDWIEMQEFGADGDVVDIQLHNIKVQNWDKTLVTIPTQRLVSGSFKNWRGMTSAGGRRIKRALFFDTGSVRFLTDEETERFKRFSLLKGYIAAKQQDLAETNRGLVSEYRSDAEGRVNLRRLTNLGTFRAYAFNYLKAHPRIRADMTLLVRQLPPGPQGVPIELYCFAATTDWNDYEGVQSDIFDHMMAIVPEFALRLFQEPAGADFAEALAPAGAQKAGRRQPLAGGRGKA